MEVEMKDHTAYNEQLFARWAPVYDGFELVLSDVRKKMAKEINPVNQTVLDIATGTGSLAIALSPVAKSVVGIDLSSKMLNVARKKRNAGNVSYLQMDAGNMNFREGEFDTVTISLGLHDMPPGIRRSVLEEVKRVLKKDGKLYILEHDLPENETLAWCVSRLTDLFESRYYLDFVQSDLKMLLQFCGFKVEKKTNFLFGHLQFLELSV